MGQTIIAAAKLLQRRNHSENARMNLRILYAAGPGDVIGTFLHWKAGRDDSREVSLTYSGQFYDLCRELDAKALVIAHRAGGRHMLEGQFTIAECATLFQNSTSAILYHLGQVLGGFRLAWDAWRFHADVALVSSGTHWFMLALLRLLGVRVIPDIHCTLWPTGHRPTSPIKRAVNRLNGWFWPWGTVATLCISPECERQVAQISAGRAPHLLSTRPTYRKGVLDTLPSPVGNARPFVLLFAGRVEQDKGVFDLLAVMRRLQEFRPGVFRCIICGSGSASAELENQVQLLGLTGIVELAGQLDRIAMREKLGQSHVVIVPTTASFVEGLNRVAIEGVMAGRPVIVTEICPAEELIRAAAIVVFPGDVPAMAEAALKLESESALYAHKHVACAPLAEHFYDPEVSWGAGLKRALQLACPKRFDAPRKTAARAE